jgi:hypothetical protein
MIPDHPQYGSLEEHEDCWFVYQSIVEVSTLYFEGNGE